MRKTLLAIAGVALLMGAMAGPATANDDGWTYLHEPHQGTVAVCPVGWDVEWHFVANQTEGAKEAAYLKPDWGPSVGWNGRHLADKVNRNVQHYWVSTDKRVLLDAKVRLPGKLVLSDWGCVPPPPCLN